MVDIPTADEIRRVSEYLNWVKSLDCDHGEIAFNSREPGQIVCGKQCGRPLMVLSDIQLELRIENAINAREREKNVSADGGDDEILPSVSPAVSDLGRPEGTPSEESKRRGRW